MYQPSGAPQSIGGVLDDGFRLYRASLVKVLGLAFVSMLAGQVPNMFIPGFAAGSVGGLALLLIFLLAMLVSLICYAAAITRMDAVGGQQEMTLGAAVAHGLKRTLPLLGFSLLYFLVLMVCALLLVIPFSLAGTSPLLMLLALPLSIPLIIFSVSLGFGFMLVILEGRGPVESLAGSHRLVWGHWWRTLVVVSVATIIMAVAYTLLGLVAGFGVFMAGDDLGGTSTLLDLVIVPVLGAVVVPLLYALTLAVYYDLRLRRSGADLEQRLDAQARA